MSHQQKIITGLTPFPDKPSFKAKLASDEANATGAGGLHNLGSITAFTLIYDNGSNLSSLNPVTFVAPVTTEYLFNMNITFTAVTSASANFFRLRITTTKRTALYNMAYAPTGNTLGMSFSQIMQMDSGDTATFQAEIFGQPGNTASIDGASLDFTCITGVMIG